MECDYAGSALACQPAEMELVNSCIKNIQDRLYPQRCLLCGVLKPENYGLCLECSTDLPYLTAQCPRCSLPMPASRLCGRCQERAPAQDACWAAFEYTAPVSHLVCKLKFQQQLFYARTLGMLMAQHIPYYTGVDVIIPVPLHGERLASRGFNQALELARWVGRLHGIPINSKACRRRRATQEQSGLSAGARRRNIRGAFEIDDALSACHVALVDDVMTTGSTINELATALHVHGIRRISAWVCARATIAK